MAHQTNIAYYRVSTKKQEASGLGLDAQRALVFGFLKKEPDFEFIETESGKNSFRVQLDLAIEMTKKTGGMLYIAKLDRLSRNVHFISGLMESRVPFICCDNPSANPFTLHILASVAEFEAKMISKRTKDALAAKKAREIAAGNVNFKFGNPNPLTEEHKKNLRLSVIRRSEENPNYLKAAKVIESKYNEGMSVAEICKELMLYGMKTPLNSLTWTPMQVHRIINKLRLRDKKTENVNEKESSEV